VLETQSNHLLLAVLVTSLTLRTDVLLLLQVFVKPDFDKYKAAALEIREIFAQYDPRFRAGSLDEAYLDLTPHVTERLAAKRAALQCAEATAAAARVQATAEMKAASKAAAAAARSQAKRQHSSRSPYAKSQPASSPYRNGGSTIASSSSSGAGGSSISGAAAATSAGDELTASSDHLDLQSASTDASFTTQSHTSLTSQSSTDTGATAGGSPSTHAATADAADSSSSPTTAAAAAAAAVVPEAFDLSELFAEAAVAVAEMRAAIKEKTALTASAGLAPNFMLAKVCADQRKPNGQFCLKPRADAVMDFLQTLPVRKVRLLT
jgi:nucleotidyltransferase/DNA polymerase involved in DNA repair